MTFFGVRYFHSLSASPFISEPRTEPLLSLFSSHRRAFLLQTIPSAGRNSRPFSTARHRPSRSSRACTPRTRRCAYVCARADQSRRSVWAEVCARMCACMRPGWVHACLATLPSVVMYVFLFFARLSCACECVPALPIWCYLLSSFRSLGVHATKC